MVKERARIFLTHNNYKLPGPGLTSNLHGLYYYFLFEEQYRFLIILNI